MDFFAPLTIRKKLRQSDIKDDWHKIPLIDYFYYKIQEREEFYQEFGMKSKSERDAYYKEVETAILFWKEKLK